MGEKGDNVIIDEVLYTYEAAVKKYEQERYHTWLCNQKKIQEIRERQNRKRKYFLNQKLIGFFGLLMVVIVTVLCGNLACLALGFPGMYAMVTKKMLVVNDYYYDHDGFSQWET